MSRFCVILIPYVNSYTALPAQGSQTYFCIGPTYVLHRTWLAVSVSCPFIRSQRHSARCELGEADLQDALTIFRWIAWLQPQNTNRGSFNNEIHWRSKSAQSDIIRGECWWDWKACLTIQHTWQTDTPLAYKEQSHKKSLQDGSCYTGTDSNLRHPDQKSVALQLEQPTGTYSRAHPDIFRCLGLECRYCKIKSRIFQA
jgi:hypothetical protein